MQSVILEVEGEGDVQAARMTLLTDKLKETGAALENRLSKIDMRASFRVINESTKHLGSDKFEFTWMVSSIQGKTNQVSLTYGFNVPIEALPMVGKQIANKLQEIPRLLMREYSWLKAYKYQVK